MHNFALSEEQQMVKETIAKFVEDVAAQKALDCDEHARFVRPQIEQLAELGMLGLPIAEADGGAGMGCVATVVALEEIAGACGSTARLLACHAGVCGAALAGLPAGKALLGELASGSKLATWIGPEHGVRAKGEGDAVSLEGRAELVTASTEADVFIVAAKAATGHVLCVVQRAAVKASPSRSLGFRAAAPGRIELLGASASVVARGADAERAAAAAHLGACITAAALACGMAQASLRLTARYAGERIAFGKPLTAQQAVAHKLVEVQRKIECARHLTYHAARLQDAGDDARAASFRAKMEAVEAAVLAADEGVQIHGGYGYVVEYHVERHYRDAKTLEVLEGGCEALRDQLASLGA